ncbi:MAG: tRNA (N6-isopentenyl adenosine(37)-C2)-methylthiotransferase MiaB [Chitinophagales bacterium]|nr:tRNA (N6-isopentenyl adenosine(37)-C2)-methylthiotransferase MiaB [Chitinophagales bacterium]
MKELYNNEVSFELREKTIDESKQGSALSKDRKEGVKANGKKFYIESYGCAMNFSDSEIVASILSNEGFDSTTNHDEADLILINTCSIRDNAEQRVRARLKNFQGIKKRNPAALIGILGCMAERLKDKLLEEEKLVDIVAGPDAYRTLPDLISEADGGQKAVNVLLSREETYADISPVRLASNGVSAFISIMRGCDNMCSFCVVPFTRGRERSRDPKSIVKEAQDLYEKGFKEVTLLGQNVDSFRWSEDPKLKGKRLIEAKDSENVVNFANLLEMTAKAVPNMRIRFSTSHPKDMLDDVLHVMMRYDNICKYIHLPVQSGNSRVLDMMNRTYDREWYMNRIEAINRIIPDCGISTDVITGFCSESEEDFQDTLSLMKEVEYDMSYMFFYSERPGTLAAKRYKDDIPLEVKKKRLSRVIELQQSISLKKNKEDIGKTFEVLVEGVSKKSKTHLYGRNTQNKVIVFPDEGIRKGDFVNVKVTDCTSATLLGELL